MVCKTCLRILLAEAARHDNDLMPVESSDDIECLRPVGSHSRHALAMRLEQLYGIKVPAAAVGYGDLYLQVILQSMHMACLLHQSSEILYV